MLEPRAYAASILVGDSDETLFMTGGFSNSGYLKTTELVQLEQSRKGPDLPEALNLHCFVKINSTTAMIIGGSESGVTSKKTWFYSIPNQRFYPGPSLSTQRYF